MNLSQVNTVSQMKMRMVLTELQKLQSTTRLSTVSRALLLAASRTFFERYEIILTR
jgi:hypothetical protein